MFGEGGFCREKLGFFRILCNLKATKPGCSLLHISHVCKRNGKLYRAFPSHFVHVAGTGTECGGQQRTGQNIFIPNHLVITSSPDLFLSSYPSTHLFPLTLTNASRDTSNFTHKSKLLLHLHTQISPCPRIFCNICSYQWMRFKTFS